MNDLEKKKKVLLITRKDLLVDIVSVFIEGLYPSTIEVADTSRKVEQCFSDDGGASQDLDLLIVEDEKLLAAAAKTVPDFMTPAIVVGKKPDSAPRSGRRILYVQSPIRLDSFAEAFASLAAVQSSTVREFCPVRLEVLVLFGKALAQDLYKQKPDQSYEIIFPKGQRLDLSDTTFTDLARSKYLFLKHNEFTAFMGDLTRELQANFSGGKIFELAPALSASFAVQELLSAAVPELGFTPELQKATKASIGLAIEAIKKDPRLADLLSALTKVDSEYKSWHSVALCYISCRLSNLMTWDSANTHYKLSLAAFLHDVMITSPALQRTHTLEELENKKVPESEREMFREHAHAAAALAREMSDFPGDVDHIVAQHHELPNGQGFPLGLNHTKISPLASLFIVAHSLTEELFDKQEKFNLKVAVARLEKTYTQGYFRRVISALKELIAKESTAP